MAKIFLLICKIRRMKNIFESVFDQKAGFRVNGACFLIFGVILKNAFSFGSQAFALFGGVNAAFLVGFGIIGDFIVDFFHKPVQLFNFFFKFGFLTFEHFKPLMNG